MRNDRLVVSAIGVGIVALGIGVFVTASPDERPPGATQPDPEIAMPPPAVDFAGLAGDPPPVTTTLATTVATAATAGRAVRTIRFSGAMTIEVEFTPLDADRRTTYTVNGILFGDVTGEWLEEGWEQYGEVDAEGHVRSVGSGTAAVEMTVPGVGTGRVDATNEWQSDNQGNVLGVSTITSGSGDLEGVTGSMRWNTTQDGDALTYQLDLTIPDP